MNTKSMNNERFPLPGTTRERPQLRQPTTLPSAATTAVIATMLGVAIGLLLMLTIGTAYQSASSPPVQAAPPPPPSPVGPLTVNLPDVATMAAAFNAWLTPTPTPMMTRVVPTSTPRYPSCPSAPMTICEWDSPTATPVTFPVCQSPVPGWTCKMPTPTPSPSPLADPVPIPVDGSGSAIHATPSASLSPVAPTSAPLPSPPSTR